MATFYIQLENKLLQISGDLTAENISKALGYVPVSPNVTNELSQRVDNITFDILKDNPFLQDGSGELNIVDEAGNIIYDKYGVEKLAYPYSLMSDQEMLTATNPLHRFLVDVSIGKLIYLENRQSLSINLSVSNVTNNVYMKTGGYQQARLPRATRQGVLESEGNSTITSNIWKFPSKYYYAWGTNFYMTITYKF